LSEYLFLEEATKILNIDRTTLYRWHKNGRVTLYKKGRRTVIKTSDVERLKTENEDLRPLER
jgi:excisionase family DNA binding protein